MISVATLQAALPAAADADPVELGNAIERAVAFIQKRTRRYFGPIETRPEYIYGTGSRVLRLKEQVVVADEDYPEDSVTVEERLYPGGTATAINDFLVRHEEEDKVSTLVRTGGGVWISKYEYAVTYERGYGVDNGPPDIAQAIIGLVGLRLNSTDERLQSETIGGVSYTNFKDSDVDLLSDTDAEAIENWRRAVFA